MTQWTRRQFSHALGTSAAASIVPWSVRASAPPRPLNGLAFVACLRQGTLQTFHAADSRWHPAQTLATAAPIHLEAHPTLPVLYVVHAVGIWDNLPRGAISAFTIAPRTSGLKLLNTQPLSLSATFPRHAAVSPDGDLLLVAATGGGIYNVLPLAADGSLLPPTAIRKELALTGHAAAPSHVAFHPSGQTIFAADQSQQTLSLFTLVEDTFHLDRRSSIGPARITVANNHIYALHPTDGLISTRSLDAMHSNCLQQPAQPSPTLMAMHPRGHLLITASTTHITAFAVDSLTGHLSTASRVPSSEPLRSLTFTGNHLLGITAVSGHILHLPLDETFGTLGHPAPIARVPGASTLIVRSA